MIPAIRITDIARPDETGSVRAFWIPLTVPPGRPAVADIDIYRCAKLLIEQHGQDALLEAALKADELLDAGDFDGQAVWLRIRKAVLELLKPGDGETVH